MGFGVYDGFYVFVTGAQIRGARAMVDWTAQKLAEVSGVSLATIQRAERGSAPVRMTTANTNAIRRALEDAGVEFIPANGGGEGVRLKERRA